MQSFIAKNTFSKETDRKLDKMRVDLSDSEKCKIIAKKLTEYIKDSK